MPNQIICCHGLGEGTTSNAAGTNALLKLLGEQYPDATTFEYAESDFDNIVFPALAGGKRIGVGNSYGGSALFRHADNNPSEVWDLFVLFDPVPRIDLTPRQWMCAQWAQRPNVKSVLSFRETASILGQMAAQCRPTNTGAYDAVKKATLHVGSWYTEYELDDDAPGNLIAEFMEHFTDLTGTGREWVQPTVLAKIAQTLA